MNVKQKVVASEQMSDFFDEILISPCRVFATLPHIMTKEDQLDGSEETEITHYLVVYQHLAPTSKIAVPGLQVTQ